MKKIILKKVKSFKRIFTKGEQRLIILMAIASIILGIVIMIGGFKIIYFGAEKIMVGLNELLQIWFDITLY